MSLNDMRKYSDILEENYSVKPKFTLNKIYETWVLSTQINEKFILDCLLYIHENGEPTTTTLLRDEKQDVQIYPDEIYTYLKQHITVPDMIISLSQASQRVGQDIEPLLKELYDNLSTLQEQYILDFSEQEEN